MFCLSYLINVAMAFSVCSINVNGMHESAKRAKIIHSIREQNCDITFVQEAHIADQTEFQSWENEWGGKAFWSAGTHNARGVGILFKPNFDFVFVDLKRDTQGRFLSVLIEIDGNRLQLNCVYAPNSPAERSCFFNELWEFSFAGEYAIIAGDFNCVENINIDKWGGDPLSGDRGLPELHSYLSNFQGIDIFRALHPGSTAVTFLKPDGSTGTRIDRIYVSAPLRENTAFCTIKPFAFADHAAVTCQLRLPETLPRGRGVWKFNCTLLRDSDFCQAVEVFWKDWQTKFIDFPDHGLWWDIGKFRLKQLAISASVRLARNRASVKAALEREFQTLNTSHADTHRMQTILTELQNIHTLTLEGSKIRSKAEWIEEGEKPTKFFFNLESHTQTKNTLRAVTSTTGNTVATNSLILSALREFYTNLYSAENTDTHSQDIMLSKLENKLLNEESDTLESELGVEECFEAVSQMKSGRSPGNDGLPAEFYLRFWPLLGQDLVSTLNYGFERFHLTESQTQSVISLLFKKGDRLLLKNWRPISLLNVDYKICTKALANRLKKVLPSVLNIDQTCGVPGRSIFENTFLLRDIFDYAEAKQLPGAFIALDQEKAFDRVDRAFLDRVLATMNFGPMFRQWIKTLYAGCKSAVSNNGWLTSYIPLERGVRQGCPLSPLLYCLVAEVLSNAIRSDSRIAGFSLPSAGVTAITSQYADDLTLTLRDSYSIKRSFVHIAMYEQASGCRLNKDKCEGLWIGSSKGSIERPADISWVTDKIKILGIWFGYGDLTEFNWTQRVVKLEKTLNLWRGRALSLKGKSLIINTLGTSKLWYTASVLPMPGPVVTKINKLIWDFLWSGKTPQVSRDTCVLPYDKGGLGISHVILRARSLKFKWIADIADPLSQAKWVYFARYWTSRRLAVRTEWLWLKGNFMPVAAPGFCPGVYEDILGTLEQLRAWVTSVPLSQLTAKNINTELLASLPVPTRATREWDARVRSAIPWAQVWAHTYGGLSSNWESDLLWKIRHRVVRTASFLTSHMRFRFSPNCKRCDNRARKETQKHVFLSCPFAQAVWDWVLPIATSIYGSPLARDQDTLILGLGLSRSKADRNRTHLVIYLFKLTLWSLWDSRNRFVFERQQSTPMDVVSGIRRQVRDRIRADVALHVDGHVLAHHRWGVSDVLCSVDDHGSLTYLI